MQFRKVFDVVRNLAFILILDSFSVFAAAQYGNIPPLLTKINNDSIELNALIAIDPVGNCEKVNSMNEELLRDINLFLKKHTTKLPSPYTIHLCFCEKANVTITEKDQVQLDEQWALKCHLKGTCEAAWITRYEYDLATKKKKHLDSWLHTSWNIPLNFTVESFSGWVLRVSSVPVPRGGAASQTPSG